MLWYPVEKLFMSEIGFDAAAVGVMAAAYAAVVPLFEVPSGVLGLLPVSALALLAAMLTQAVFEFGPLLLVALGIHAGKLLRDAVPSTVRAGVASGVSSLSWLVFLPFSLVFGWLGGTHGVHRAAFVLVGAAVVLGACCWPLRAPGRRGAVPPRSSRSSHVRPLHLCALPGYGKELRWH